MSDLTTRCGILGMGNMACQLARRLRDCRNSELVAVGRGRLSEPIGLASSMGVPKCHGSYEELVEDPTVDVVYIATPHSTHSRMI